MESMAARLVGKSSKAELLKTIEDQNLKIDHYESKLRDLVRAYKGLIKEKEVLDQSLKCLSTTNDDKSSSSRSRDDERSLEGEDKPNQEFPDPLNVNKSSPDYDLMKEQLTTLTGALSTVTQEKAKLESSYLAEKRKLKSENEELVRRLENEREQTERERMRMVTDREQADCLSRMLQEQVGELKAKIRSVQYEREKEHSDHGLMMRELQKLLSKERMQCEQTEHQCEELKMKLMEKERMDQLQLQYQKRIQEMADELQAVRERLKASEDKSEQPIPMLLELQHEMGELKAQHRIQVQKEQRRADEAESRVGCISVENEERVASLEDKLSELSDVVGHYERCRLQDQDAIHKLKDRVVELDIENTALARAAHSKDEDDDGDNKDNDRHYEDVHVLADKILKLKAKLKLANVRSDDPVDIEALLRAEENESDGHSRCRDELVQLKEEFERYKLRAQSVLKNKNNKDVSSNKESDTYKKQISELRERLKTLRDQLEESDLQKQVLVSDLRKSITRQNEKHAQDLRQAENDYKKRVSDLEQQLHKHRDRTIALLVEKDREIEILKHYSTPNGAPSNITRHSPLTPVSTQLDDDVAQLNLVPSITDDSHLLKQLGSDAQNLFFAQEQSRREVEISAVRKNKRELEQQMRELRQTALTNEESLKGEIEKLLEDVRRHERGKNRESANLEYLKNVVYQYMTCWDKVGKQQMLNAIATILQFSPREKEAVVQHIGGWWSGAGAAGAAGAVGAVGAGGNSSTNKHGSKSYAYSMSQT